MFIFNKLSRILASVGFPAFMDKDALPPPKAAIFVFLFMGVLFLLLGFNKNYRKASKGNKMSKAIIFSAGIFFLSSAGIGIWALFI